MVEITQETEQNKVQASEVELNEVSEHSGGMTSLDLLLDIPVPITVVIGQTEMPVRKLLQMGPGAVLKLNKPISEPVDLCLKDTPFAKGKIVVVEEQLALRIEHILGPGSQNDSEEKKEE